MIAYAALLVDTVVFAAVALVMVSAVDDMNRDDPADIACTALFVAVAAWLVGRIVIAAWLPAMQVLP